MQALSLFRREPLWAGFLRAVVLEAQAWLDPHETLEQPVTQGFLIDPRVGQVENRAILSN